MFKQQIVTSVTADESSDGSGSSDSESGSESGTDSGSELSDSGSAVSMLSDKSQNSSISQASSSPVPIRARNSVSKPLKPALKQPTYLKPPYARSRVSFAARPVMKDKPSYQRKTVSTLSPRTNVRSPVVSTSKQKPLASPAKVGKVDKTQSSIRKPPPVRKAATAATADLTRISKVYCLLSDHSMFMSSVECRPISLYLSHQIINPSKPIRHLRCFSSIYFVQSSADNLRYCCHMCHHH